MSSKIVLIIFAVNFIFSGRGDETNLMQGELKPVMECYKASVDSTLAILEAMEEHPDNVASRIRMTCVSAKEYGSCLGAVIKTKSPPVPKMFNFLAAKEYQYHFLLKKAGMCPHISYDELKKITLKSGIMKEEKLFNIEDDVYVKCVGDALRKCIYEDITLFEHRVSTVEEESKFSECMRGQAKTCTAPMMQHLMSQSTAYKKHMEALYGSEENYRA